MLKAKLEKEDFALAMILQDPILCPEFLRNTRDGAKDPNTWPQRQFKYRWYQRDILSDKSPYVSLVGGRAIGKCQPATNNVYTENGYVRIGQLKSKQFYAWAWNEKEQRFALQRAFCADNGEKVVYDIETESGYKMSGTMFHPVLTDAGWKNIEDIKVGDKVAVATKLPHVVSRAVPEHEARLLGYFLFKPFKSRNHLHNIHVFKHPAVLDDVKRNLGLLGAYYRDTEEGLIVHRLSTAIGKKRNRHPLTHLLHFYDFWYIRRYGWISKYKSFRLHERMRRFPEENLVAFLGAIIAEYANVSAKEISIPVPSDMIAKDLQELFLRFGVEMLVGDADGAETMFGHRVPSILITRDKRAVHRILTTFNMPNYRVGNLAQPEENDPSLHHRFDTVISMKRRNKVSTYLIEVEHDHTYITDNIIVHNSLVLEDRIIFDVLNNHETMVETPEMVLTTANQAQMTPVIDKFNIRCLSSPLIRPFVKAGINRQKGTMDFDFNGRNVRLNARIAGMKGESNVIGLHIPRIKIDESQVYPISSFRQLLPTLNTWEPNIQLFACGVN